MKHLSWRTVFSLTVMISLAGAVVHGLLGNPWAAATHVFIGTIAAALRGAVEP